MNWQVRNPLRCTTDGCTAKAEIEALREKYNALHMTYTEAYDQLAAMTKKLDSANNGLISYAEDIVAMTQERDTLNAALDAKITICGDANLAAAQARIVELREALDRLGHHEICHESCEVCKLLATHDDSSALDAALEADANKWADMAMTHGCTYMVTQIRSMK